MKIEVTEDGKWIPTITIVMHILWKSKVPLALLDHVLHPFPRVYVLYANNQALHIYKYFFPFKISKISS